MDTTYLPTSSPAPESYVVRIYRRDPRQPNRIIGTVERVADGSEVKFNMQHNMLRFTSFVGHAKLTLNFS